MNLLSFLKIEPVRLYSLLAGALALVTHFVPDFPTAAVLGVVAALLGVGQVVREQVTPVEKVL